jgi:hypothetical protein
MTTTQRATGEFAVRNTRRAVAREARHTGRILVTLPFNDYLLKGRNAGKVFTGEMKVHRKPVFGGGNAVEILAAGRWFQVEAYVYRFRSSEGKPLGRARIMFRTAGSLSS